MKLVNRLEIAEFKMREGDFELSIRTKKFAKAKDMAIAAPQVTQVPVPQTVVPHPPQPQPSEGAPKSAPKGDAPAEQTEDTANLVPVKSPIVGTFYRSSSPDKPPYVKVGDTIEVGSVVCIVEAMKLFNEIESEVSGKIVKVLVEDATPVEYDQVLFLVDPNG